MSTQRRASRRFTDCMEWHQGSQEQVSASRMRSECALFRGITAPLMSIIFLAWAWLFSSDDRSQRTLVRVATKSLLSDHCYETLASPTSRRSLPPPGRAGFCSESVPRANHRSSFPHIPVLSVRIRLRHHLPHAPAGLVRRAERHDGKRDLYFQHAA